MFEDSEEKRLINRLIRDQAEGRRMTPIIFDDSDSLVCQSGSVAYKMKMTHTNNQDCKAQIENLALDLLERMKHLKSVAFVSQRHTTGNTLCIYLAPMNIMITALITGCLSTQPVPTVVGQ